MTYPQLDQQPQPSDPPSPPAKPARPWLIPFAVVGSVVAIIITVSLVTGGNGSIPGSASANPANVPSPIEAAHDRCTAGDLGDGGTTLVLDMEGEEYGSGTATFDDVTCVLVALDVPTSVTSRMNGTRALDGMQDAEWDGIEASWTYHPDAGLDVILTMTD
ncbi:hypothetical protein [Actinophytocola sediminis]